MLRLGSRRRQRESKKPQAISRLGLTNVDDGRALISGIRRTVRTRTGNLGRIADSPGESNPQTRTAMLSVSAYAFIITAGDCLGAISGRTRDYPVTIAMRDNEKARAIQILDATRADTSLNHTRTIIASSFYRGNER